MNQKRPNVLLLAKFRQLHSYFAMFAAPSILFFCLTGILQLFSFHEAHGNYNPPAVLQTLASLHKDQALSGHHGPDPSGPARKAADQPPHDGPPSADMPRQGPAGAKGDEPGHDAPGGFDKTAHWTTSQILLKLVFGFASAAAIVSTCLGLWVGLSFGPRRNVLACILAAGVVVPVLIMLGQAL